MRFLWLILAGLCSGVFAGMGMGGGTFLVPLLTLVFGVGQLYSQSTNVLCFLILAIVCFVIYSFKKMINFKVVLCVGVPASILAGLACVFSLKIHSDVLRMIFAGFIVVVGILMFFSNIFSKKENEK